MVEEASTVCYLCRALVVRMSCSCDFSSFSFKGMLIPLRVRKQVVRASIVFATRIAACCCVRPFDSSIEGLEFSGFVRLGYTSRIGCCGML